MYMYILTALTHVRPWLDIDRSMVKSYGLVTLDMAANLTLIYSGDKVSLLQSPLS